jgi:hypothetical protein
MICHGNHKENSKRASKLGKRQRGAKTAGIATANHGRWKDWGATGGMAHILGDKKTLASCIKHGQSV